MPKGVVTGHPNRRTVIRLNDMLGLNVALWKIAEVIGLPERTLYHHYGKIIKAHERSCGNTNHEPSPESKAKVKTMASTGIAHKDIARIMDIGKGTLEKYYSDELDTAATEANWRVGANMLRMATGPIDGKHTYMAAQFWLKTRAGWIETERREISGPDGAPIQMEHQTVVILPDNNRDNVIDGDAEDGEDPFDWSALSGPDETPPDEEKKS